MDIEFLLQAYKRTNPNDPAANLYDIGDLIDWHDVTEGHVWSQTELYSNLFRIVRVTGLSQADIDLLESKEPLATPEDVRTRRREIYLDPTKGNPQFENWWFAEDRTLEPIREIARNRLNPMLTTKPVQ